MRRFTGRRIAVIGAAPGQIGGAIVARLVEEGASVVVGGRNVTNASAVAESVSGPGKVVDVITADLADDASLQRFMDDAARALGGLDGLANNAAGYGRPGEDGDAVEIDLDSFDALLHTNLRGHVLAVRHAIPHLKAAGGGSIVLTASLAGLLGEPTRVSYGISKAGLMALTRHVASRWGKQGIRCNTIVPGRIISGDGGDDPVLAPFLRRVASTRLGTPADIAGAASFLLSDDAAFVNGTNLVVDGGLSTMFTAAPADDDDFFPRYPFSRSELGLD